MGALDEVPVRQIGTVRDGERVRVVGRVVAADGELLTAPLTGRRCVAFDAAVWSHERVRSGVDHWLAEDLKGVVDLPVPMARTLLGRSLRAAPFVIEDATGRALVDARGAFVRLGHDFQHGGPEQDGRTLAIVDRAFLEGVELRGNIEFWEGAIEVGEPVLVSGMVSLPDAAVGRGELYRGSGDHRIRIAGSADHPADVTDHRDEIVRAGGDATAAPGARVRQHVSGRMIIVPEDS